MKTMFLLRDLGSLMEKSFSEEKDNNRINKSLKKGSEGLVPDSTRS